MSDRDPKMTEWVISLRFNDEDADHEKLFDAIEALLAERYPQFSGILSKRLDND